MLPQGFKNRMIGLLGEDYPAFESCLEMGEAVRGLRINLIKTSTEEALPLLSHRLTPLSYCGNGYVLEGEERMGTLPEHHSGMIYMQDPGAMASLSAIDIQPHWWVADLCAAPGGKSSQAAERLGDEGYLLSNEYVTSRAKITVGNFERLGISRATVTSVDTAELAKLYPACFDLVIADAPCSGEGMFRKSDDALQMWSEDNIALCAQRQAEILLNAAKMVRPGGYLLYSTCTYAPEENEYRVAEFIRERTDFSIIPVKDEVGGACAHGIDVDGSTPSLTLCRRFYPHISPGEGQFLCLMQRDGDDPSARPKFTDQSSAPTKAEEQIYRDFCQKWLLSPPDGVLRRLGDRLCVVPRGIPAPPCRVMSMGVLLGEIKGKDIIPSHHFYSAYGKLFKTRVNLTRGDPKLEKYLRGEEIEAEGNGPCAVTYCGVPLGGGKISGGRLKNHYPKGLRNK